MAIISVVEYNPANGAILSNYTNEQSTIIKQGITFILGRADVYKEYVDISKSPPVLKLKPQMSITQDKLIVKADGVDNVKFSGIPFGAVFTLAPNMERVDDGVVEWSTNTPGVYNVNIRLFPYLDWNSTVEAVIL